MDFVKALTPKDTEEVKPGFFIQTKNHKNGRTSYRQVHPVAWNGKIDWKTQVKSVFSLRTIFTIALILFIYFGYLHDYRLLQEFHNEVIENPVEFCIEINEQYAQPNKILGGLEVYGKEGDPNPISNYP